MSYWEEDLDAAKNDLIALTITAIRQITILRYYKTERGFAGEFYSNIKPYVSSELFPNYTIPELEVQKNVDAHYGVTQRPDILVHIPLETGLTQNANENNFVVYAFKLNGNLGKAIEDYGKLNQMFVKLNYDVGIFINIGSYPNIHLDGYVGDYRSRIHEFSVGLTEDQVLVRHAYFADNQVVINEV